MYPCMYLDLTYHPFSPSISHRLLPNTPSSQIYILLSRANILSPVNAARLHSCGVTHWAVNSTPKDQCLSLLKTRAAFYYQWGFFSAVGGLGRSSLLYAGIFTLLDFV